MPAIPPSVHPLDDVHHHFATVVLPHRDTWFAVEGDDDRRPPRPRARLGRPPLPRTRAAPDEGIGTQLLDHAKQLQPDGLDLWAFRSNTGARRFYERHGFVAVAFTEGDNEEGEPDVRYHWSP